MNKETHSYSNERPEFLFKYMKFDSNLIKTLINKEFWFSVNYDFEYPEDKLIVLAQAVKTVVDDKTKYTDWSKRDDIKAELKVDLIILLAEHDYPTVDRDEVYKEIFEQAENFKKYQNS